jgi:diguanylate cyclase (GGDEF)-like protein/PAS domain S-box-containing protein
MIEVLPPVLVSRLLEDALDAVIIIDDQCRIRYLNGAMSALTGYAAEELLGRSLDDLLPAGLRPHHNAYVNQYLQSSGPSSVLTRIREFELRHRDGDMIPIEMKAIDLGVIDAVRYFGAFMLDLRARRAMEMKNTELMLKLEQQALCDALTGLPNRRAFAAEGAQMMARAARSGDVLAIGVADVDHFKKINDEYGHAAGDAVLCALAAAIREVGRTTDMVARLGGEEFGLLFANATLEQAAQVAERVRAAVAANRTLTTDGMRLQVTISIGLAQLTADGSLDDAMRDADKALYRAKHRGRNRVELTRPNHPPEHAA